MTSKAASKIFTRVAMSALELRGSSYGFSATVWSTTEPIIGVCLRNNIFDRMESRRHHKYEKYQYHLDHLASVFGWVLTIFKTLSVTSVPMRSQLADDV
jgi:phenolic acid decarboxylase